MRVALAVVLSVSVVTVASGIRARINATIKSGSANLCLDGRMAPELILIGAARSSSTTMARDLKQSSSIVFPNCLPEDVTYKSRCPRPRKELHFFNKAELVRRGRSFWLQHYPECNQETRLVGVDLTPIYHIRDSVPDGILKFYGNDIFKVRFLTLLREPLAVIQSYFYFESMQLRYSFKEWLIQTEGTTDRHILNAMYAPALERFFSKIPAGRFIIAPMQYNTGAKDGMPVLWQGLLETFGVAIPSEKHEAVRPHKRDHPGLEEELGSNFTILRDKIYARTGPLKIAEVLASSKQDDGPVLYGFKQDPKDVRAIADWIESSW